MPLQPRYRWDLLPLAPPPAGLLEAATAHGISPRVASLLARRGVGEAGALARFLGPAVDALHDPALLPDAATFRDRILRARDAGERVLVFGDFDADGLTGLAIMTLALRRLGVDVEPYVPSRLDEGHGLSMAAVGRAEEVGATVVVTVDTGSSSAVEVAAAGGRGIDVLVTDHHRVPAVLPAAVAVVNPHRPDSAYPERTLAGSGVAFKLAQLLHADIPGGAAFALSLADLATIGTVADVAPVLGENRAIARLGLELLRATPRPGLAALLRRGAPASAAAASAGADRPGIDLETVSFVLAPRLNAAGRVGEAMDAARLLLAEDAEEAARLAARLEAANATRRDLTRLAVDEARAALADDPDAPAVMVRGPWTVGIVGLVAARLSEDRGRPAIVGSDQGETVRASCRGDGTLDLAATLESCSDLLVRHGGHRGAAGFEVAAQRWDELRDRFLALAAAAGPADQQRSLAIDLDLPALAVDYALLDELGRLAPCGTGHPEPLVVIRDMEVVRVRQASGGHAQVTLRRERDVLDGIAFGWPELASAVGQGDRLDIVARLTSRRFGGFESLQLEVRDAAPAGFVSAAGGGRGSGSEAGVAAGSAADLAGRPGR